MSIATSTTVPVPTLDLQPDAMQRRRVGWPTFIGTGPSFRRAVVPERPGWGFSFDPAAIKRYRAS